ncbi:MAG: hypothetical protein NTV93_19650 [Verrucomicrobia bacterium]|nr:hypothetical protein [Verrucomicrobiota bacterium]
MITLTASREASFWRVIVPCLPSRWTNAESLVFGKLRSWEVKLEALPARR